MHLQGVLSTICLARYGLAVPPAFKSRFGNECGGDESPRISSTSNHSPTFRLSGFIHPCHSPRTPSFFTVSSCLQSIDFTLQFIRLVVTTPGGRTQSRLKPCSRLALPPSTVIRKLISLTMGRTPWGFPGKYTSNAKSTEPADKVYAYVRINHQSTSSS